MCVTPFTAKTAIYRHFEMDPRGENQNSFFPEHQQYYNVNYYGSQFYCDEPQPQTQPQYFYLQDLQQSQPQVESAGASMQKSFEESNEGATTSGKRKKTLNMRHFHTPKRSTWSICGKRTTTNWKVKNARKVWAKIVDDLNAKFEGNRTVDKCMRKIKYLIDKYKEKKDWNRKQSGGNLKKSPFYDEIDEVLGCRDFVTFNNVKESAVPSPNASTASAGASTNTSASSSPKGSVTDSDVANNEKIARRCPKGTKAAQEKKKYSSRTRGKRDSIYLGGGSRSKGDKLTTVLEEMQKSQAEQIKMMSQFMGAMVEVMKNTKS